MTTEEFASIYQEGASKKLKKILVDLMAQQKKAQDIIDILRDGFTWESFKRKYTPKTGDSEDVFILLQEKAKELRVEGRISTASTFECALISLQKYHIKQKLTLDMVNVAFLKGYKKWMETKGNSNATTGIYLRNVRTIYNTAIRAKVIAKETYPFGTGTDQFIIPSGKKHKKGTHSQ